MQEEIDNLTKFQCFRMVPRSEAVKHGRLVKSKWVFKVKYNSDNLYSAIVRGWLRQALPKYQVRIFTRHFHQSFPTRLYGRY